MKLDLRPLLAGDRLLSFDYEISLDDTSRDAGSFLYGVGFPSPLKVVGDITNTAGYMRMALTMSVEYTAEGIEVETVVDPILYGKIRDYIVKEC